MRLITVDELWECTHTIIDVRAPVEFAKGHIPNAINIPLLNDEERHQVGIQYKELGQRAAVTLGLKLIGPKMSILGQQGVEMAQSHPIVVYCQRGGKRSQSMAWLWSQLGLSVYRLDGGYKSCSQ